MAIQYDPKTDAALDAACSLVDSPAEWRELGLACLDQAGLPAIVQSRVRATIDAWLDGHGEPRP